MSQSLRVGASAALSTRGCRASPTHHGSSDSDAVDIRNQCARGVHRGRRIDGRVHRFVLNFRNPWTVSCTGLILDLPHELFGCGPLRGYVVAHGPTQGATAMAWAADGEPRGPWSA